MKKALFALAVAAVAGFAWAETKTWPADYDIAALTAEQVPDATDDGAFGPYAAERVAETESLTTLDTFLFAIFDAEGSLSGLSTMAPGCLLLFR